MKMYIMTHKNVIMYYIAKKRTYFVGFNIFFRFKLIYLLIVLIKVI